ncbi:MAG: M48 family metalloprotease [Pseudomonadota bacterium]
MFPLLLFWANRAHAAQPAIWFPDAPIIPHYDWSGTPCPGCETLPERAAWRRMAELAGVPDVRFRRAPDESLGPAYSVAPDIVVLSPAALKLETCQLAFLVGHEIVHIAQRHFDEDAIALSVLSGKPAHWTARGEDAMQLADGDFSLALRAAHLWQAQEQEADWLGSLLAAACGCDIEAGALAWFRHDEASGGGLAAAHAASHERIGQLAPFVEMARRLAARSAE